MALILPINVIQGQILYGKLKGHIELTICVSYKLSSYVSEILAEIDHKSPNWDLSDLENYL